MTRVVLTMTLWLRWRMGLLRSILVHGMHIGEMRIAIWNILSRLGHISIWKLWWTCRRWDLWGRSSSQPNVREFSTIFHLFPIICASHLCPTRDIVSLSRDFLNKVPPFCPFICGGFWAFEPLVLLLWLLLLAVVLLFPLLLLLLAEDDDEEDVKKANLDLVAPVFSSLSLEEIKHPKLKKITPHRWPRLSTCSSNN